jgi:hypothetical protein
MIELGDFFMQNFLVVVRFVESLWSFPQNFVDHVPCISFCKVQVCWRSMDHELIIIIKLHER